MFQKLESLRGVAACLVVLFHSPFIVSSHSLEFLSNSYLFVDFFFILSGFVMSHAYSGKIGNGMPFGNYVVLRLGRLYPLHLFMLLAWIPFILFKQYLHLHMGGRDQFEENNLSSFLSNLFLLHSFGVHDHLSWNQPSWSISAEFFAYVFFFFATCFIDRARTLYVPVLISLSCYAFLFSLRLPDFDITFDYGFIRCLGAFYLGVAMFRVRPVVERWLLSRRFTDLTEVVAASAMILAVTFADLSQLNLALALISFPLVLLVFSSEHNGIVGRLLDSRPLRLVGLWSYSIYMVHKLVLVFASNLFEFVLKIEPKGMGMTAVAINAVLLAVIILVSRFTYVHIEKRFRDLVRSRVVGERGARQPAAE